MIEVLLFFQELIRAFFFELTYEPQATRNKVSIELMKMLSRHNAMGSHTDLVLWSSKYEDTFYYHHDTRRPFGTPSPFQCPFCMRLRTLVLSEKEELNRYRAKFLKTNGIENPKDKEDSRARLGLETIVLRCSHKKCDRPLRLTNTSGTTWLDGVGNAYDGLWQGIRRELKYIADL